MARANNWTKTGSGAPRDVRVTLIALTDGGVRMVLRELARREDAHRSMTIDLNAADVTRLAEELSRVDLLNLVRPDEERRGRLGRGRS